MSDTDRDAHILELRRLVQSGEYQIDPQKVAASIIRESEKSETAESKPISKTANTGE
jgi:anti-sigma28 factor (negative regulator of flagellin synthesis)